MFAFCYPRCVLPTTRSGRFSLCGQRRRSMKFESNNVDYFCDIKLYAFPSRRIRRTSLHQIFLKLANTQSRCMRYFCTHQRRLFLRVRYCLSNIDPASRRLDDVLSLRLRTPPASSTHTHIVTFSSRPSRCYGFRAPFVVSVPASSRLWNNSRLFVLTIVECFVMTYPTEL